MSSCAREATPRNGARVTAPTHAGATSLLPPTSGLSEARRRVFEAGVALFGRRGYHGVSVRDLAAHLGLKPMALYAHVPSKQQLLFELKLIGYQGHRDRLLSALLDAGPEPAGQIRALCRAHVQVHLDHPALARVTHRDTAALSAEQVETVLRVRGEAAKVFTEVVERGQRLGAFRPDNPLLVVQAVTGMGIRAAEWWSPDAGVDAREVVETFADFAVRLLETPDGAAVGG